MARTQDILVLSLGLIAGLHTHCLSLLLVAALVPSGAPYGPNRRLVFSGSCLKAFTSLPWKRGRRDAELELGDHRRSHSLRFGEDL